jgi:hypothetical protein
MNISDLDLGIEGGIVVSVSGHTLLSLIIYDGVVSCGVFVPHLFGDFDIAGE